MTGSTEATADTAVLGFQNGANFLMTPTTGGKRLERKIFARNHEKHHFWSLENPVLHSLVPELLLNDTQADANDPIKSLGFMFK